MKSKSCRWHSARFSRIEQFETLETRRVLADVGGLITADTVWSQADSPFTVTSDVTVRKGATLTIEPGSVLQFRSGTGLRVEGRLIAEGTPWQRIVFDRQPGVSRWDGIAVVNSLDDNRIAYADMIRGDSQGEAVNIDHGRLLLDNISWVETQSTVLELEHPSLIVRNSHFPVADGEVIHGEHLSGGEYLIIDGNVFENSNNGSDVIDFLGTDRPGPVMQVLNNVFLGGGDDGLDLDGTDAHIEGNLFMNFRKNTTRATTSNAIATGLPQSGESNRTQLTIARNIFLNSDHALLLKEDAFATIENNLFIGMRQAAIQFDEVGGSAVEGPGKGAILDGNIFQGNAGLFKNLVDDPGFKSILEVHRSLLPNSPVDFDGSTINAHDLGTGNIDADPKFVDASAQDYRLASDSPARGKGPSGLDMGAYVAAGPVVTRLENPAIDRASFRVGGPGLTHYRYRVDGGSYGDLTAIANPIELTNLSAGDHSLQVVAMNSAGEWFTVETPAFGQSFGRIIAPSRARTGERLPIVLRATDHRGQIDSTLSALATFGNGQQLSDVSMRFKKGVGTLAPRVTANAEFQLALPQNWAGLPTLNSVTPSKSIAVLDASFPAEEHSGQITGNVIWKADVEHRITGNLAIPAGSSLTIEAGARIALGNKVNVSVLGELRTAGTEENPVVFNSLSNDPWGGIRIQNGAASFRYTFFTNGGGDTSQAFGHSGSQPVLRADRSELNCDNCFVLNNVGKGFASTNDSRVTIHESIVSEVDTGGEFSNSLVQVTNSYVKNIPNDDGTFANDDNDGFYFLGVHSSGEPSLFQDSFVINTKDDGLDHNGANLRVVRAWIEGVIHEGIASSERNSATVEDSVFLHNNQGTEAGYGSPQLTVRDSVIVRNDSQADPDSQINAGVRFGDGYNGSNGNYTGHITAVDLILADNGDNVRNFDGTIPGPQDGAIDITYSLTNDADYNAATGNLSGVPVFSPTMHSLRGSAGFAAGTESLPMGRQLGVAATTFTVDSTGNPPGDLNLDGRVDETDIQLLCAAINDGVQDAKFDLNNDSVVSVLDQHELILNILKTTYGDANLDGTFNSGDLVRIFQTGEYEDGVGGNSTWSEGDWNCDGDFSTADLVVAFQAGGYSQNARLAARIASDEVFADWPDSDVR